MNYVFDDYVTGYILSFVDVFDKLRMKRVCKKWQSIIGDVYVMDYIRSHEPLGLSGLKDKISTVVFFVGCYNGSMDIVNFALAKLRRTGCGVHWNDGLMYACEGGHMGIVKLMIANGACDWNTGLCSACSGGHMAIAKLMLSNGATDISNGLCYACESGQIELADLMISNRPVNLDMGFAIACIGRRYALMKFLLTKGVKGFNFGLYFACANQQYDMVEYLISIGADKCNCGKSIEDHLKKCDGVQKLCLV